MAWHHESLRVSPTRISSLDLLVGDKCTIKIENDDFFEFVSFNIRAPEDSQAVPREGTLAPESKMVIRLKCNNPRKRNPSKEGFLISFTSTSFAEPVVTTIRLFNLYMEINGMKENHGRYSISSVGHRLGSLGLTENNDQIGSHHHSQNIGNTGFGSHHRLTHSQQKALEDHKAFMDIIKNHILNDDEYLQQWQVRDPRGFRERMKRIPALLSDTDFLRAEEAIATRLPPSTEEEIHRHQAEIIAKENLARQLEAHIVANPEMRQHFASAVDMAAGSHAQGAHQH